MSGILAVRDGMGWRISRPKVYVRTLGKIIPLVGGQMPKLKGNGAGPHQLRRQLGLLIGFCGKPVSWAALRDMAGGRPRPEPPVRPFFMVGGLVHMLRRWGMGPALVQGVRQLTLLRHSSWATDTDELTALAAAADLSLLAGDTAGAIAALELAIPHCGDEHGHRFLAELVDSFAPGHSLRGQAGHWSGVQREVVHRLARLCLAEGGRERAQQALDVARLAFDLDGAGRADFYLAADAADACGQPAVAAMYRRQGDGL